MLCKYSRPRVTPANTILIPSDLRLLNAFPLPLHLSKKEARSPPYAIFIPEYIYFSQENENIPDIIKGHWFYVVSFLDSSKEVLLNLCLSRFVLFTAIFFFSTSSWLSEDYFNISCWSTTSKTLDWPPFPSSDTISMPKIGDEKTFKFSCCKNLSNFPECFFIESTESNWVRVVDWVEMLILLKIFYSGYW